VYVTSDVLALADVFENVRSICLDYYGLDYYGLAGGFEDDRSASGTADR
jgi:hypothetical protein